MRHTLFAIAAVLLGTSGCLPAPLDSAAIDDNIAAAERNGDCLLTALCIDVCDGDVTCRAACLDGMRPKARVKYDTLVDCTDQCVLSMAGTGECSDTTSESCKRHCRTGSCRSALIACAAGAVGGTSSCIDGNNCLNICENTASGDGLNCGTTCVRSMSQADADALIQMTDCYRSVELTGLNESQATTKLFNQCRGELTACYGRGQHGPNSCLEGMACVDDCASVGNDKVCQSDCATQLTSGAQAEFVKLFYCFSIHDGGDWTVLSDCADAFSGCAKSTVGGLTCSPMQAAFYACLATKDRGLFGCLGETLASGRFVSGAPFLAAVACLLTECSAPCGGGGGACVACNKTKCGAALKSCNGG